MNFKFRKPKKRKYRYMRRGWAGEGEQARRDDLIKEFFEIKRKLLAK